MEVRIGETDPEHAPNQRVSGSNQSDHDMDDLSITNSQKLVNLKIIIKLLKISLNFIEIFSRKLIKVS